MATVARDEERRRQRRRTASEERPGATPLAALHRAAGNRAVTALVQRQPVGGWTFSPTAPQVPDLRLPATSPLAGAPAVALSDAAAAAVRSHLEGRRYEIGAKVSDGAISMPEVVQSVREAVPEAASAPVADIESVVREVFGALAPPPQRRRRTAAGTGAELAARIANALPSAPKLRIDLSGGSIALTMSGRVARTTVGGATVTATGTPGGGEVTAGRGGTAVTVSGSADAFGMTATVDRAAFAAKIEKDAASGAWSKWEVGLRVAVVGGEPLEEMTDLPELQRAATAAESAVRRIIAHLQAGGRPDDPEVRKLIAEVKPAIEGVARVTRTPSGPRVTVGAGVKGGDERLGTTAGLSLIIEF